MTEQIQEKPHHIKGFDAVAHEAMLRRFAAGIAIINQSNQETVNKHVSAIKDKIKSHKKEQNQFKKTISKAKELAGLASMIRHSNSVAGC